MSLVTPDHESEDMLKAKDLVLKRLQRSALLGQPLLPFVLHNEFFEFPDYQRQTKTTSSGCKKASKKKLVFWDEPPSVASPSTIIASKSLHTIRRLVMKQWAPRARTGSVILREYLSNRRFISTGFVELDNLVSGGVIMTGEITELFGTSAVGKTQMCHKVAAMTVCQLFAPTSKSPQSNLEVNNGATVLYLDTKGDFSAVRLQQLIRARLDELNVKQETKLVEWTNNCLARVYHRLAPGVQQLTDALVETRLRVALAKRVDENETPIDSGNRGSNFTFYSNLQLIVIDCITAPFAPFSSGFPGETNFQLRSVIAELRRLTGDLHIAVLVTNNIRYYGDSPQGCLGTTWASVPHVSLYMHPHDGYNNRIGLAAVLQIRKGQRYLYSETGTHSSSSSPFSCLVTFQTT